MKRGTVRIAVPQDFPPFGSVAIPPTVGFAVQVVKGTALASIIGFVDLTKAAARLFAVTAITRANLSMRRVCRSPFLLPARLARTELMRISCAHQCQLDRRGVHG